MGVLEPLSLNIGSFGLMIKPNNQKINLTTLTNEFKLDVYISSQETVLMQKKDGITTSVSESFNTVCDSKKEKFVRPEGFVRIQYSKNKSLHEDQLEIAGRKTLTRPPIGPIPDGAWCYICKNKGPKFHKYNCKDPLNASLKITLYGLIMCINAKAKKAKQINSTEIDNIKDILTNVLSDIVEGNNKSEIIKKIKNTPSTHKLFYEYNPQDDEWPLLDIDYNELLQYKGFKVKKEKDYFSNSAIISYNFPSDNALNDKSVSVRVYESGLVHLISCPWDHKDFYKIVIDKINETDSLVDGGTYILDYDNTNLINVFTYTNLIKNESEINLNKIYNYLWPVDNNGNPSLDPKSPKRIYTKVYAKNKKEIDHDYLLYNDTFYRYTIEYRTDLSTPKLIIKMLPCVAPDGIPASCKPYKFTVMFYTSGKIQSTFSFCKDDNENDKQICDSYFIDKTLKEQFDIVEEESKKTIEFIYNILKPIEHDIIIEKPLEKDTISTTVAGIIPYKKKDKIKIGEKVDIFNEDTMDWDSKGKVTDVGYNTVIVNMDEYNKQDVRAVKQSVMALSKDPQPFTFKGKCEDNNYFVPFGGTQARDNLYYPQCAKKTKDKYSLYIDQILHGFPQDEEDEIMFKIDRDADYDKYSGILDGGITEVGNTIDFIDPDTDLEMSGTIIDKYKTHNRGLDNIIEYKVEVIGDNGEVDIKVISGKNFSLKYRQDRRWTGIDGNAHAQRLKLIKCAKKLGLTQSPYISKSLNSKLQNKILNEIKNLLGVTSPIPDPKGPPSIKYFGRKTIILTPHTLDNFTKRPYSGMVIPDDCQRVALYATPEKQYFVDDTLLIMELDFDNIQSTFILDGYLKKIKNGMYYYPIDCVYHDGKLSFDYISDSQKSSRLYYTIYISKYINKHNNKLNIKIENPEGYICPRISSQNILGEYETPVNFTEYITNRSIIKDINETLTDNKSEIVFVPQKGKCNYMMWKKQIKTPIVLESIQKISKDVYIYGVGNKKIKHIGNTHITNNVKSKYVRFDLNINPNGSLNTTEPLILHINPVANKDDILSYERTQSIVDAMLNPIPYSMFKSNRMWKNGDIALVTTEFDSGINSLIFKK